MTEHLRLLEVVSQILRTNQLFAKKSKCEFGQPQVEYLRYIISVSGVRTDQKKVSSMIDWPTPASVKELRGFFRLDRIL